MKEVDFECREITVRDGKGQRDRVTLLPDALGPPLRRQLQDVRVQHKLDLSERVSCHTLRHSFATHLLESGFLRTELLTVESTKWPDASIDDNAEKTRQTVVAWKKMNDLQGGDPAKLAKALIALAGSDDPPLRWPAGADAVETFEKKARVLVAQANAPRALSSSLAHDDAGW